MLARKLFCFLQSAQSGQVNIQSYSMNTRTANIDLQNNNAMSAIGFALSLKLLMAKNLQNFDRILNVMFLYYF